MGMVISCSKDNIRKWLDLFPVLSIVVPSKMTYDMNGISVKQINKELRSNQQYIWKDIIQQYACISEHHLVEYKGSLFRFMCKEEILALYSTLEH